MTKPYDFEPTAMCEDTKKSDANTSTLRNVAIGSAAIETVTRFGSANAEFVKAYTGIDNETRKILDKGLKKISKCKVHKDYKVHNIKQQAGYSAEVHKTASTNAENIIQGKNSRLIRTDDMPEVYGKNHPIFDHVEIDFNGKIVPGSGSQMKMVSDLKKQKELLNKITNGAGKRDDRSRYLDAKLDLPSEQVKSAKQYCTDQAESLRKQADYLDTNGKPEIAAQKRAQAANFDQLRQNIRDSGMTTEQAIFYRKHPTLGTAIDITVTSHRAGLDGAKFGAAIGGAISTVTNVIAVCQDSKDLKDALLVTTADTVRAAAIGYGTAFAGSAIKGLMQQSTSMTVRTLSRTSLPTMAVSVCLELGSAITRYARGEIDGTEFLEAIGEKGSGMLASGMGVMSGQIAIPVPIVGGLIGGIIGYTLSSMIYADALAAFKDAKKTHQEYLRVKTLCEEARVSMEAYRARFQQLFAEWLSDGRAEIDKCLRDMDATIVEGRIDDFAYSANALAACMGKTLQFATKQEFDKFMETDEILIL